MEQRCCGGRYGGNETHCNCNFVGVDVTSHVYVWLNFGRRLDDWVLHAIVE